MTWEAARRRFANVRPSRPVEDAGRPGPRRTVRMAYEVATFRELRERLRCKEMHATLGPRRRHRP